MRNINRIKLNIDKEDFKKKLDIKDGKDYILTKKDKQDIANSIDVPIVEKVIEKTETIKEVALKDTPKEVKDKLETLKKDERLDKSAIKGLEDLVDKPNLDRAISILDQRTQFLINKATSNSGGTSNHASLTNLDYTSSGHTGFQETLVSATNIKTVNGTTLLGSGDLVVAGTIEGSGTTNEIPYWVDSNTLGTLAVATYPSLTELSYVKGVTSAIQTQLNAKGNVSKVGTPVDNQVGVWTGDGTIEGTTGLTFATGTLTVNNTLNLGAGAGGTLNFVGANTPPSISGGDYFSNNQISYIANQHFFDMSQISGVFAVHNTSAASYPLYISNTGLVGINTIGNTGYNFQVNGTTDITGALSVGGTVSLGANNLTMTGSIAATGARVTKGWFTDIESTNIPTVGGIAILTSLTAPQFTTIELGHATDTTISRVSAGVVAIEGVNILTTSSTSTTTNKRNQPRIVSATSYTTDTGTSLDVSTCDIFIITAQAGALKFNNPSGTPTQGEKILVRIKDDGTARALTYDTQYRAIGTALPSTTVANKTLYMGFIWNATDSKFDLVTAPQEA